MDRQTGEKAVGADSMYAAMRMLCEGAQPTLEMLARVSDRSVVRVKQRAEAEGWTIAASDPQAVRQKRIQLQYDRLIAEIERLTLGEEGEAPKFDKARVDTIMAMVKALEKIGETTRSDEDAKDKQIKEDAELAAALERIDERIHEIARYHAKELGAGQHDGALRSADAG